MEVLPPLPSASAPIQGTAAIPKPATALSDEAVQNIFELVWRDTRMLFSTAQKRPLPVVFELAWERVPIAMWFLRDRADKFELSFNEHLQSCPLFRTIAPRAAADLKWQRAHVEQRLQESRSTLWPTLRTLLMRPTTHQRVLQAARTQLATYNQASVDVSGLVRVARKPLHVLSLWIALWRWGAYAMRWVFLYLDLSSIPGLGAWSSERRQRVRTRLIERAVEHGLELQRRVDTIDRNTFLGSINLSPNFSASGRFIADASDAAPTQPALLVAGKSEEDPRARPRALYWRSRRLLAQLGLGPARRRLARMLWASSNLRPQGP